MDKVGGGGVRASAACATKSGTRSTSAPRTRTLQRLEGLAMLAVALVLRRASVTAQPTAVHAGSRDSSAAVARVPDVGEG